MTDFEIDHFGTPRHSGRYPWGSGDHPYQSAGHFMAARNELKAAGLSETEIAVAMGFVTTKRDGSISPNSAQLRTFVSEARNQKLREDIAQVHRMRYDKQMSPSAIAGRLGLSVGTVNNYLKKQDAVQETRLRAIANVLKDSVDSGKYVDIGEGVEAHMGISQDSLKKAVMLLEREGYKKNYVKVTQLGTGLETSVKLLTKEEEPYRDIMANQDKIDMPNGYSTDLGDTFTKREPPLKIDPKRVDVRYGPDGGAEMDGVIQLRRDAVDLNMGQSRYSQVRIAVGDGHYLKGMAIYSDDLPKGVDIMFNTNKENTGNKLDAMKKIEPDPLNPFGSSFRQTTFTDAKGVEHLSPLNIVNEEGGWNDWSKQASSQFLSKQQTPLIADALDQTRQNYRAELDEIKSITNPVLKKHLLDEFSGLADAKAVDLKAASLPRSANHVILPLPSLKDNEIYAPGYKDGEMVALVRHPHGGIFEIPVLKVNNRNKEGKTVVTPSSLDAVGINPKVAEQLSGADFDGDTALVIPMAQSKVSHSKPLEQLKNFDPKRDFKLPSEKGPDGEFLVKGITDAYKQKKMGEVSNLVTDMTIKGAPMEDIARAVKHSMVVIDAEKHRLDIKMSAEVHGILALKKEYQTGGASTLISRSNADVHVEKRKLRSPADGGPIDPKTGELVYVPTGEKRIGKDGTETLATEKTARGYLTTDTRTLMSKNPTPVEILYADHSNRMRAMANEARKEYLGTPTSRTTSPATKAYKGEVGSLRAKLVEASKQQPLERKAQLIANIQLREVKKANPNIERDTLKKEGHRLLKQARERVGKETPNIKFEGREWEAIQAGAVSPKMQADLFRRADPSELRTLATPKYNMGLAPSKMGRAKAMANKGYTLEQIAQALGVSPSTISKAIK